jgi:ketosteroid isomerase-like protein
VYSLESFPTSPGGIGARYLGAALALVVWVLGGTSCDRDRDARDEAVLSSLVDSERTFARAAAELGTLHAFRAYLADDAVLFRPRAVNAQEWLSEAPDTPGLLSWEPVVADVSAAGDLGYTTGPWEYRQDPDDAAQSHGNYFTVWKKQADGSWKAVIDHGISNPPPDSVGPLRSPSPLPGARSWLERVVDIAAERETLLQVDRAFAGAAATQGTLPALAGYVSSDVRVLREGRRPVDGIEALRELLSEQPGSLSWDVSGGDVSRSGDLGYTYGEYELRPAAEDAPTKSGVYVRAWRRGPGGSGSWRVAVEVMTPLPQSPDS